jgi:saccharopine dehydrogenase-like NADP-dependent oxidoreductase
MKAQRHILLLGSGLMAESVVIQLLKRPENKIHIASNIVADAEKIAKKYPDNLTFSEVEV